MDAHKDKSTQERELTVSTIPITRLRAKRMQETFRKLTRKHVEYMEAQWCKEENLRSKTEVGSYIILLEAIEDARA